jgi:hypothetical protein
MYPANALGFYAILTEAANFEFLPSESLLTYIFRFNPTADPPFNSKFEMLGYGGHNLIMNLGTSFIIFVGGLGCTMLLVTLHKVAKQKKDGRLYKVVDFFYSRICYSMLIRYMIEGYMELTLMTMVNMHMRLWTFSGDQVATIFSMFFVFCLAFVPVGLIVFIARLGNRYHDPDFNSRWGSIYADLNMDHPLSKWYNLVFVLRRLAITIAAIFFKDYLFL